MAAAVDLADLIPDMKTELSVPGVDSFTGASDDEWLAQLRNAFWESVLDGIIVGYKETDGLVVPLDSSSTVALTRDLQQVVIYYAGLRILRNRMVDIKTKTKSVAGPVTFEVEQSAMVLKGLFDELIRRRKIWLERLSDMGATDSFYVDAVVARTSALDSGSAWWS
jgi:hypothetical protein